MKRVSYLVISIFLFLIFSYNVYADYGDLKYEIGSFTVTENEIIVSGYAFIHRTQTYVSGPAGYEPGRLKVKLRFRSSSHSYESDPYDCKNDNYNFYYQMYNHDGDYFLEWDTYKDPNKNICNPSIRSSNCYYEDISFTIRVKIDDLYDAFPDEENISISIAAYNEGYTNSSGGHWSSYEPLKIPSVNWGAGGHDRVEIQTGGSINGRVRFIAQNANLQDPDHYGSVYYDSDGHNVGAVEQGTYSITKYNGRLQTGFAWTVPNPTNYRGNTFLAGTYGPSVYAICVNEEDPSPDACSSTDGNGFCIECGGVVVAAYGSWITLEGSSQISFKLKPLKKCEYNLTTNPSGSLSCNSDTGKSYDSKCDELTIKTDEGILGSVGIEQTGYVASLLSPLRIFAGGGFNFGIMYYHNIKWWYVKSPDSASKANAMRNAMANRIKDYDTFVSNLDILNLTIDGQTLTPNPGFMAKKCFPIGDSGDAFVSSPSSDGGLTIACIFTFPTSTVDISGLVNYNTTLGSLGADINNKYYTPINYSKNVPYKITATIRGMSRITDYYALEDSKNPGIPWTGNWSDNFNDCEVEVYPLLYKKTDGNPWNQSSSTLAYNFIYRPIDIYKPFPNRNPGINWFDWYAKRSNVQRLESSHDMNSLQYVAVLNNDSLHQIKDYNNLQDNNGGYYDWYTMSNVNGEFRSSFVDRNYFTIRRQNIRSDS